MTDALGPVSARRHSPVASRGRQEIWSGNLPRRGSRHKPPRDAQQSTDRRRRTDQRVSGARHGPM